MATMLGCAGVCRAVASGRRSAHSYRLSALKSNSGIYNLTHKTLGSRRNKKRSRLVLRTNSSSKADDSSLPSEASVESALKLLGVAEHSSFEEILSAKKSILQRNKDDPHAIAQVEAAYDMLLMHSLMQRRSGKVVDNAVRFADVKERTNYGRIPSEWVNRFFKDKPVSFEVPSGTDLGIQTGVYGALMGWNIFSAVSLISGNGLGTGDDVPGLILATSFGASLYFLRRKNVKFGKATAISVGSLVVGAVIGGAVESWLRVDIVPLFGIRSPAVVVSEFVLLSQWLSSMYLL